MTRSVTVLLGSIPCLLAVASAGFAQTAAANTTATTTNTPLPVVTTAPAATTVTTQTTTAAAPSADVIATPTPMPMGRLPKAGGEPAMFAVVGSAFSIGMLGLRRRFAR